MSSKAVQLGREEVAKIAHLARLEMNDKEAEAYAGSLSQILGLIEQMNAVDTTGIAPMAHPRDAVLRLREDVVTEENQRDRFQAVAPETENGLFLVPKVIE
ncbi:MAG: Asp-tRNA(Asn)/Glu-tRNA(Gln) amidotransferase subunit GatC [Gammaproteobacteria bacterium]|nr:Asp-tRNA(Asn)/Glu-tRNA(Gln) amidotransferase subunit GatC [Gammaproteobacteria bacterium]